MKFEGKKMDDLKVLHEDNHILIIDKPVQISSEGKDSIEEWVKGYIKKRDNKPGKVFLTAVHRLDKPASGILVFAKTSKALTRIHEQIRNGEWKKKYFALVETNPKQQEKVLENYLLKDEFGMKVVSKETKGAKLARLKYTVVKDNLLTIELYTGRKHQIRVQLSHIGLPIQGDQRYGAVKRSKGLGIDLHHAHLILSHPVTKALIEIKSTPAFIFRGDCKMLNSSF